MNIRTFIILFLLIINVAYGQQEDINAKLKAYGIPEDYIISSLKDGEALYYFTFRSVTWLPSKQGMEEIVEEGEFNPELPIGERWKLLKINGKMPNKHEEKKFSKTQNTVNGNLNAEIDDHEYKIVEDSENILKIRLKYKKETLPKRYEFLSKCSGLAYIDKDSKRLTQVEYRNESPVKIWGHRAIGLSLVQYFTFLAEENRYVIDREEIDIETENLTTDTSILYDIHYSNYRKVK